MSRAITLFATIFLGAVCSTALALYSVSDQGEWPKSWPQELEPLRKQASTLVGPHFSYLHYAIRFTKQEEFAAAWPHLLKLKTAGAPIILVRGENFFLGGKNKAGVIVHSPPAGSTAPPTPIPGQSNAQMRWMNATYLELVVDGEIVDLNRLALPSDTPIVDERFPKEKAK